MNDDRSILILIEQINSRLDSMDSRIDNLQKIILDRIDAINQRLEEREHRLDERVRKVEIRSAISEKTGITGGVAGIVSLLWRFIQTLFTPNN
jgi:hypothetical protein